jgi:hypothetical protein
MPYQLDGQLVTRNFQRPLQEPGAVTAIGGAFVAMSAAIAAVGDAAMSNVETEAKLSEVGLMAILRRPIRFTR